MSSRCSSCGLTFNHLCHEGLDDVIIHSHDDREKYGDYCSICMRKKRLLPYVESEITLLLVEWKRPGTNDLGEASLKLPTDLSNLIVDYYLPQFQFLRFDQLYLPTDYEKILQVCYRATRVGFVDTQYPEDNWEELNNEGTLEDSDRQDWAYQVWKFLSEEQPRNAKLVKVSKFLDNFLHHFQTEAINSGISDLYEPPIDVEKTRDILTGTIDMLEKRISELRQELKDFDSSNIIGFKKWKYKHTSRQHASGVKSVKRASEPVSAKQLKNAFYTYQSEKRMSLADDTSDNMSDNTV